MARVIQWDFFTVTSTQLNSTMSGFTCNDMLVSARHRREGRCRWKDAAEATKTPPQDTKDTTSSNQMQKRHPGSAAIRDCAAAALQSACIAIITLGGMPACLPTCQRANVPSFPVPPPSSFTRVPSSASAGFLQPPLYDQHIYLRRTWNGPGPWTTYTQTLFVRHTTPGNRQDQAMSQVQQATLTHLISSHLISIIPY